MTTELAGKVTLISNGQEVEHKLTPNQCTALAYILADDNYLHNIKVNSSILRQTVMDLAWYIENITPDVINKNEMFNAARDKWKSALSLPTFNFTKEYDDF